jgi:hypothetical protein
MRCGDAATRAVPSPLGKVKSHPLLLRVSLVPDGTGWEPRHAERDGERLVGTTWAAGPRSSGDRASVS